METLPGENLVSTEEFIKGDFAGIRDLFTGVVLEVTGGLGLARYTLS